ncbi:MAG: hypothetical protein AABW59_02755 [archaeon]
MMRRPMKPPDGAKLKETADMVAWRKEFEKMSEKEHVSKLKELGLDDEDIKEFDEMEKGVPLEKELLGDETTAKTPAPSKKKKK